MKHHCQDGENKVTARFYCSAAFNDTIQKSNFIFSVNEKNPTKHEQYSHMQEHPHSEYTFLCDTDDDRYIQPGDFPQLHVYYLDG